jgi:hypothetical protein
MKSSFNSACAVAFVLASFASSVARADEPTPADVETAKVAFAEGLALREKGDEAGALARFRAAYALVPTPITGLEVGRSLVATNHVLDGRALLLEVARMPKHPGESDKAQASRDAAAELAEKARADLATLTVETDADAALTIDDAPIPRDAARSPRVLDPGHHVVSVRAHGRIGRADVDLKPGEQHQVHVDADQVDATVPIVVPTRGAYHPGAAFWVSVVVTAASAVTGIVAGSAALGVAGHLASECPNRSCPPSAWSDLDASSALGWTSTIAFAVSGAGVIAAVIALAAGGHRDAQPRTFVGVGLGGVTFGGTF